MPRLDGYGLARAIRAPRLRNGAARTPIIALTANVMQGEPNKCLAAGMDDFAAKPTTIPTLAARLARWLPHLNWTSDGPDATEQLAPATVSRAQGADGLIDAAALDALTGGDAELAASLIDDYLEVTRADLHALRAALDAHDTDNARRQAHRIKGAARMIGAHGSLAWLSRSKPQPQRAAPRRPTTGRARPASRSDHQRPGPHPRPRIDAADSVHADSPSGGSVTQ